MKLANVKPIGLVIFMYNVRLVCHSNRGADTLQFYRKRRRRKRRRRGRIGGRKRRKQQLVG